jgi:hypothetical protein
MVFFLVSWDWRTPNTPAFKMVDVLESHFPAACHSSSLRLRCRIRGRLMVRAPAHGEDRLLTDTTFTQRNTRSFCSRADFVSQGEAARTRPFRASAILIGTIVPDISELLRNVLTNGIMVTVRGMPSADHHFTFDSVCWKEGAGRAVCVGSFPGRFIFCARR